MFNTNISSLTLLCHVEHSLLPVISSIPSSLSCRAFPPPCHLERSREISFLRPHVRNFTPTRGSFIFTMQVKCKANAEPSSLELCWAAAFTRDASQNASQRYHICIAVNEWFCYYFRDYFLYSVALQCCSSKSNYHILKNKLYIYI